MREVHPFGLWIPKNPRALMLGSFPGVQSCTASPLYDPSYNWFYRSRRGQFWNIMSVAYERVLTEKEDQVALMEQLGMAMGDVILSCRRTEGTNADTNLVDIEYNTDAVKVLLATHPIETIYFTSAFVATKFQRHFREVIAPYPHLRYVTLPSPSPRYARMSPNEKARRYRALLPPLL